MDLLANISVLKLVATAIIGYVVKMVLDWAIKIFVSPRPTRKYRFDKISCETKVDILDKIKALVMAESDSPDASKSAIRIQIKFLYEQMGIYLPVWHCHQLIACMAQENIGSQDVWLNGFLKNPVIGRCPVEGFYINKKAVKWSYVAIALFSMISISVLVYAGLSTLQALLHTKQEFQFFMFLLIYSVAITFFIGLSVNEVENIWLGVKFGKIFERWVRDTITSSEPGVSTVITPPLKLHHEE
ncbi:Uncharacterised protein [Cedecea neteri]|uniref:Uncharacterized protein n=1 Tax=Cedecea neteri TaxID=158822 RepID=A0A291E3V4_9ENTR|nr:hypothetical protein [Cedecea neteri]ATF94579.1 hypothetical protein CO704_22060 [Cedecea neteri]SQA98046.1 Uncharacterised protein [Cedecea neteri]